MRLLHLALACALALTSTTIASRGVCGENEAKFTKGSFSFIYPKTGWTVQDLPSEGTDVAVRLSSDKVPDLSMFVRYTDSMPKKIHEESLRSGGERTFVYGNGLAENFAKETGATAYPSVGLMNFLDQTDLAAHFTLVKPGEKTVWTLDAFTYVYPEIEGAAIMGFIKAAPPSNHTELGADRFRAMQDLYDVVQSIEVAEAAEKPAGITSKVN